MAGLHRAARARGRQRARPEQIAGGGPWAAAWWLQNGEAYGTTPTDDWRWLLVAAPHTGTPFDLLHTIGTSLAVLGACILLTRSDAVRRLTRPLVRGRLDDADPLHRARRRARRSSSAPGATPAYYWAQVVAALVSHRCG